MDSSLNKFKLQHITISCSTFAIVGLFCSFVCMFLYAGRIPPCAVEVEGVCNKWKSSGFSGYAVLRPDYQVP